MLIVCSLFSVLCIDTDNPDIWCILYLLCELYMRLLLTIGDDEFFDKKNTNKQLSLSDIVTFSNHLKVSEISKKERT